MTNAIELAIIRHMLGDRLKQARKAARMTQEKAAERIGVSRSAVTQWERGTTNPSHDNLVAAASAYRVDVNWLLGNGGAISPERNDEPSYCERALMREVAVALYQALESDNLVLDSEAFADLLILLHDWTIEERGKGKTVDGERLRWFIRAARAQARTAPGAEK
jgi:transcriptional regulator with XRE-family HTH domain